MEYLKGKNGNIYLVKGIYRLHGRTFYNLKLRGVKRIYEYEYEESQVNRHLKKYKPGFFEKIKFFFTFN